MATTKAVNELKINLMPDAVHEHFTKNNLINDNELYLVGSATDVLSYPVAVASEQADYAICLEWTDGNPNKEDRNHRFVELTCGTNKISIANSNSDVCGATTNSAAFIENYAVHSEYTSNVGILGIVTVIDNGTCTVGDACMPDDNGYAVPSSNDMGYRVINRVDANKIQVTIKPNDDMVQRIKTDVLRIMEQLSNKVDISELDAIKNNANTTTLLVEKTAFKTDINARNQAYNFDYLCVDLFDDFSSIDTSIDDGNLIYNNYYRENTQSVNKVSHDTLTLRTVNFAIGIPPSEAWVMVDYSGEGTVQLFFSKDNGTSWTQVENDTLSPLPESTDTDIRVKVTMTGPIILKGIAWGCK